MALSSGIRFRCYPTRDQQRALSRWMGCKRVIYNAKVAEDRYFRSFGRKSLSLAGTHPPVGQKYSRFKNRELTPYLYDVPSQILRNGATRFMGAYSRFFKGLARPSPSTGLCSVQARISSEVFIFEALNIKNMTNAPKPKQDENGNYVRNGARAKAGLNRAILDSAWGKIKLYTTYKAKRYISLSSSCLRTTHRRSVRSLL